MAATIKNAPSGKKGTEPAAAARLGRWKKLLFSAIAVLVFFGIIELALAIFGVRPLLYEDDPYVGFASSVPLFVKQGDQMTTAANKIKWFNPQTFPRKKAAGTRRIFCMGGSTTFGRPFRDPTSFCGWLREYLPAADPEQKWELVNAGGISYASYRVAALMEELVNYQPDVFIIYTGNNEFLEARTYGEIKDMPASVRGVQATLAHSRTYSLISRVVKGGKAQPSEPATGGGNELAAEVDTILDHSVGPEAYERDTAWKEQVLAHYRFNLARMVDIARAAGAEVVFVTPGVNERNCTPFKSQHREGLSAEQLASWEKLFQGAKDAFAGEQNDEALALADQAITIDPEYAHLQYLRAQVLDAQGMLDEAKLTYERALAEDVCPLRCLAEMAPIMAEVAADRAAGLVDFRKMCSELARDHLPGEDLFLDHVHPTIEAQRLLSLALVDKLGERGVLEPSASWGDAEIARIKEKVMAKVSDYERGIALRNLANVMQWSGKYEDAYAVAKKSLELSPADAYANFVTGDLAEKLGKKEEAMKQYQFLTGFNVNTNDAPYFVEAHFKYAGLLLDKGDYAECVRILKRTLALKPGHAGANEALPQVLQTWGSALLQSGQGKDAVAPLTQLQKIKPGDLNAENLLGIALIQAGQPKEAIPHLLVVLKANTANPAVHNNLASAYAQSGEKQKALQHFQETVKLDPGHFGANANLGELHLELGQLDIAENYFRRVLEIQPGNPMATERLRTIGERRAGAPAE